MRRRDLLTGVAAALALAACSRRSEEEAGDEQDAAGPEPAAPAGPDPAETIRPLYQRYFTDPAVTTFPSLIDQAPWSDDMRALLAAMIARSEALNEPILDFDPFVNAQDWQIRAVNVTTDAVVYGSHATARAQFENSGTPQEIVFDLVWQHDAWRVDNIRSTAWDLRQIAAGP